MSTIYEDTNYQEMLDLFRHYSCTKSLTIDAIKATAMPMILNKGIFLDIGAGNGRITQKISLYFKKTVIVEPKKKLAKMLKNQSYEVYESDFQSADLKGCFDFILCAQVLYHVHLKEWDYFLSKMLKLLSLDGLAMVVIGAPRGSYYNLCLELNPAYHTSKELIEILKHHQVDFFIEPKQAYYYPDSLEAMFNLCRFSILEGCLTDEIYPSLSLQEKEEIDRKIMEYAIQCRVGDNKYRLLFERDFIYFRKMDVSYEFSANKS